nr:ADP-ribosyl cyclase/cyclic ADP-ribose hydrolase 2-like [Ovis aries]
MTKHSTSTSETTTTLPPPPYLQDMVYSDALGFPSSAASGNQKSRPLSLRTGLDYQSCPTSEDCENNPVDYFWRTASIQYARDSSGVISVMLNGSEPAGAYPVKGFFADFEIPYLQKDKITQIDIWVMHEIGEPKVESCGEGSVKLLEERLDKMGFQYSCTDDYRPVKLLKCVEHSTHPDCALSSAAVSTQRAAFYAVQGACFIFPLLAAFASVARM